ncbi:MAG: hypothetical protein AB7T31_04600 [Gemmatimonadales bacterium]
MSAHRLLSGIAVWCALGLFGGSASGQLAVIPVHGLTFGTLTPGVPLAVPVTDAARRAEFSISGSGTYVLTFNLPSQLVSAGGRTLPISFNSSSGRAVWNNFGITYNFDPRTPYSLWLFFLAGGARVYLGGTASPSPSQAPGNYTATIRLVVSNAGT